MEDEEKERESGRFYTRGAIASHPAPSPEPNRERLRASGNNSKRAGNLGTDVMIVEGWAGLSRLDWTTGGLAGHLALPARRDRDLRRKRAGRAAVRLFSAKRGSTAVDAIAKWSGLFA